MTLEESIRYAAAAGLCVEIWPDGEKYGVEIVVALIEDGKNGRGFAGGRVLETWFDCTFDELPPVIADAAHDFLGERTAAAK